MRYQWRMILYYATVAILVTAGLGVLSYQTSMRYETQSQKNGMMVEARSLTIQTEDRFSRMDAIMNYILSDASMLSSMTILGRYDSGQLSSDTIANAKSNIATGISTDYIIRNSYRTVFYNQDGFLASSFTETNPVRLRSDDFISGISYLPAAAGAGGHSVLVAPHVDRWGTKDGAEVYSLVKALQGHRMGFLEVENTVESLAGLDRSDPGIQFMLIGNDSDLLYSSDGRTLTKDILALIPTISPDTVAKSGGYFFTKSVSPDYRLTVLCYKPEAAFYAAKKTILGTSVMAALIVFWASFTAIVLWSYVLVKPVKKLTKIIAGTNLENLEQKDVVSGSDYQLDEFKALAQTYQNMTERLHSALINERRSSMLSLQAQFDSLQAQVNPHFIYNVLNIISSQGVISGNENIAEMCAALASMLRYTTGTKERYAKVSDEMEYIDHYFYLLKARYGDRIAFDIDVEEEVRAKILPKSTMQQIVENSVSHGFRHNAGQMKIKICGRKTETGWEIRITDNGEGFSEESLKSLENSMAQVRDKILVQRQGVDMEIGGLGLINAYARCFLLYQDNLIFRLMSSAEPGEGAIVVIGETDRGKENGGSRK
ncbi:MAG: histidine kinase [Lachnospiraceae bacterium]|jgi:two-component system sensor histidine kinase YesM|nr:histidine kinase [Lachnospiraceae bacterium]